MTLCCEQSFKMVLKTFFANLLMAIDVHAGRGFLVCFLSFLGGGGLEGVVERAEDNGFGNIFLIVSLQ